MTKYTTEIKKLKYFFVAYLKTYYLKVIKFETTMNAIKSLYIPRVQDTFNAEFIVNLFNKYGIAQVSRVAIEPIKISDSNWSFEQYNRVYIGINFWHDTECAFNLIQRLRNPRIEARIVYSDDNWWPLYINKYPDKLASSKRVLTLFEEKHVDFYIDDLRTLEPQPIEMIKVNVEKTKLLHNIIENFKNQSHNEYENDFDCYLREMNKERCMYAECVM